MCGRYSLTVTKAALMERFPGEAQALVHEPRYNVAPTQRAPVIRAGPAGRQWMSAIWGFPGANPFRTINARVETLDARPLFRRRIVEGRCLVPADGFYEWPRKAGPRPGQAPMRYVLRDRSPFAMAGLWMDGPPSDGAPVFVILTTRANERVARIHDRMPVLLDVAGEVAWLDLANTWENLRERVAEPYPADALEDYPVEAIVNSPTHDSPECIAERSAPPQLELW